MNVPPLWVYFMEYRRAQNGPDTRWFVAAPNRLEALRRFLGPDATERSFRRGLSTWGDAGVVYFDVEGFREHWVAALAAPGIVFELPSDVRYRRGRWWRRRREQYGYRWPTKKPQAAPTTDRPMERVPIPRIREFPEVHHAD